jgi:hypothetical protein
VLFGIAGAAAMLLQQADLALGEDAALRRRFLFQPQQPVNAQRKTVPLPHGSDGGW